MVRPSEAYSRESMKFILGANFHDLACRKVPQSEPRLLKETPSYSLRDKNWKGLCKKDSVMMSELYSQRDSFNVSSAGCRRDKTIAVHPRRWVSLNRVYE